MGREGGREKEGIMDIFAFNKFLSLRIKKIRFHLSDL